MKKMMIALVAMFAMTMSVNAQSNDNLGNDNSSLTFERLSNYLDLTINQIEPVKTAMAQFNSSMDAYYQLQDTSKGAEAWGKIEARHKKTMKKILSVKQYDKYTQMLDLTVKNRAEKVMNETTAVK